MGGQPKTPTVPSIVYGLYGLGAALLQKDKDGTERPVFFASRLMNDSEKEYPQIDKEFLAVVWALERLDAFVYGQDLTVRTDHRPLLGIMRKPMAHMSTRQQRFVARALRYTFSLEFVPGREMLVADFLSRAVSTTGPECACKMMGTDIRVDDAFVSMIETVMLSDELTKRARTDAERDDAYMAMLTAYQAGCDPREAKKCGEYWSERTQFTVEEGLLYFEGRLVVPRPARGRFLESLHRGHVAYGTMAKRAQTAVWWPAINNDMKQKSRSCGTCQRELPAQQREPMLSFEIPPAPGLVLHADYFDLTAKEYLLVVDGFSGWTEVMTAKNRRPEELKRLMRIYMSKHGVPRRFHSDQGSTFMAAEFREFCEAWGIKATEGSAKHPRGNAIAEAQVKKIKRILRTAENDDDLAKALIALHQTPLAPGRPSPAQLHMGRNLRDELHPQVQQSAVSWEDMREWKRELTEMRRKQFDRGTRPLEELQLGAEVMVWHQEKWQQGKISRVMNRPRSYEVRLRSGMRIQRNRHLIRTVHPGSTVPKASQANPASLLQVGHPACPLPLLGYSWTSGGGERRAPSLPPSQTPAQDRPRSPMQDQESRNANRTTPGTSSNPVSPGTPTSPSSDVPRSPGTASTQSSRSYASVLQTPSTGSRSSPELSSPEPTPTAASESESDSDESQEDGPATAGRGQRLTPPTTVTRAGRGVRPPVKYTP